MPMFVDTICPDGMIDVVQSKLARFEKKRGGWGGAAPPCANSARLRGRARFLLRGLT